LDLIAGATAGSSGRTWEAGAGSRLDGGRGEGGPVVGRLRPPHGLLEVDVQLLPVLTEEEEHELHSGHPLDSTERSASWVMTGSALSPWRCECC